MLISMDKEIRALLDHAAHCRRTAAEIAHQGAVNRLEMLAAEYEWRARRLAGGFGEGGFSLPDSCDDA